MSSPSSDQLRSHPLAGHLVVFTGKLSALGRKDACALVARLGGVTSDDVTAKTTMLVVGAEGFGAGTPVGTDQKSQKLKRAEELNAQGSGIHIVAEPDFCRLVGVPTSNTLRRQYYAIRDLLSRYASVREDHVRYLMNCGVIRPVQRNNADTFFEFQDVAVIKQLNDDLERGASFRSLVRALVAERAGQLSVDLRIDGGPAKILSLRRPAHPPPPAQGTPPAAVPAGDTAMAEEYFRAASALDDGDDRKLDAAANAYRRALEYDPYLVPALINLANIHYSRGELVEAQALYERAIGLEPDFFEAHFNLGNIYHDLARYPEALSCYREALRLNGAYADAHFYLAVTLEKIGQSVEAKPHWRAYQQLAPNGEWVQLAKEFSE